VTPCVTAPTEEGGMHLQHQRWSDLSARRRVGVVVVSAAQLALTAAAYRDLARRDADEVNGPKAAWALAILVNWVGPLTYFAKGRVRS
jgi:hypothetical protein